MHVIVIACIYDSAGFLWTKHCYSVAREAERHVQPRCQYLLDRRGGCCRGLCAAGLLLHGDRHHHLLFPQAEQEEGASVHQPHCQDGAARGGDGGRVQER